MPSKKLTSQRFRYQYAAKFICTATIPDTSQQSSFPPGNYFTAINIHNPFERSVKFRVKIAQPGQISKWLSFGLKGDEVVRLTCKDIEKFEIVTIHGFEGFMVIESLYSLDVTAVYTAAGGNSYVVSMDVEEIKERKLKSV
jgi:hypothetical protein